MVVIGEVEELRRFPVKSMVGQRMTDIAVTRQGLAGDRVRALIDAETGKVATAKLPHRWRKMLEFQSRFSNDGRTVEIVFPDGAVRSESDPNLKDALSHALGRAVRFSSIRPEQLLMDRADPDAVATNGPAVVVDAAELPIGMGAPEGGFFDFGPIHFMITSSLEAVAAVSLSKKPESTRFRPNLVIRSSEPAFAETSWVGATIAIGDQVRLRVILPSPRCAVPTLPQDGLPADPGLTLNIGKLNRAQILDFGMLPCLGAYAEVISTGTIAIGDRVSMEGA